MYMPAAERESPISTASAAEARSPFARLNDLLAQVPPGKPAINLAVGEPQHPVPPFVEPVLQKHIAEFGRYPANKGNDNFRRAVEEWLSRRYALPRALDPEHEIIVLNGTREGLFLGAIAARRYVGGRKGRPAILYSRARWRSISRRPRTRKAQWPTAPISHGSCRSRGVSVS